ncbi:MAG: CsgG/HfaB family protein, partial [Chitinivibrionia bacterium]|nr:CsgG/HfaB family protein [Chitinivibrionia bacterium]
RSVGQSVSRSVGQSVSRSVGQSVSREIVAPENLRRNFGFVKVALFALFFNICSYGQTLTIDEAIAESMEHFSNRLPSQTRVVILNIESESRNLSNYIISESDMYIMNNTRLSLVDKTRLHNILREKEITDLNMIDETTALEIGRRLGAIGVILGSISRLGGNYRFRVQALNTADGSIIGMQSLNVAQCEILADLTGTNFAPQQQPQQNIAIAPTVATTYTPAPAVPPQNHQNNLSARERMQAQMSGGGMQNQQAATAPTSITLTDVRQNSERHKNYFWLSGGFQQFSDFYQEEAISPPSMNLEIGGINGRRGFTVYGIFNHGQGNIGFGSFLGRTSLKSEIFRFNFGTDIGLWEINTRRYDVVRNNWVFGGPSMKFLLGYNPTFVSFGLKCLMGIREETNTFDRLRGNHDTFGFTAMFVWNVGMTFTF